MFEIVSPALSLGTSSLSESSQLADLNIASQLSTDFSDRSGKAARQ